MPPTQMTAARMWKDRPTIMAAAFYRCARALSRHVLRIARMARMRQNHRVGGGPASARPARLWRVPMPIKYALAVLGLGFLAGCTRASPDEPVAPLVTPGIAKPFLIALKPPVCAFTLAMGDTVTTL